MKIYTKEKEIEEVLRNNNLWGITNYFFIANKSSINKSSNMVGPLSSILAYNNFIVNLANNRLYFLPLDNRSNAVLLDKLIIISSNEIVNLNVNKSFLSSNCVVNMYTYDNKLLFTFKINKYYLAIFREKFLAFLNNFNYNEPIVTKISMIKGNNNEVVNKIVDIIVNCIFIVIFVLVLILGFDLLRNNNKIFGIFLIIISIVILVLVIKKMKSLIFK